MSSRFPERARRALLVVPLLLAGAAPVPSVPATLRVCADPNNLPFSNRRGEGFENRVAELLAGELGAELLYTWWAQRRGFLRNTLNAGECDVVLGLLGSTDAALTTAPWYRSTYVFVTRARGPVVRSLDDDALRRLRVGIHLIGGDHADTPPGHALARRGIVENVVGYSIYGDYSRENPPARIIEAVAAGEIDVAIVWGPFAGYFAPRQPVPLRVTAVRPDSEPGLPFRFDIAMAVRRGDDALRRRLERAVERRRHAIDRILASYGVPRPT
jgi:mxaJ protein